MAQVILFPKREPEYLPLVVCSDCLGPVQAVPNPEYGVTDHQNRNLPYCRTCGREVEVLPDPEPLAERLMAAANLEEARALIAGWTEETRERVLLYLSQIDWGRLRPGS